MGAEALRPGGVMCVTAVTLETLGAALPLMKELLSEADVVQMAVTGTERVAGLSMLRPESPIFLSSLSMTNATLAMYPESSRRDRKKNMVTIIGRKLSTLPTPSKMPLITRL